MRIGKKNQNLTLDEFRPVLVVMLLLLVILAYIQNDRETAEEPVTVGNAPSYSSEFEEKRLYCVETLVELDEKIYILPGRGKGFVQVYDYEGEYQYSMFFQEHMNGGFSLGTDGEYLYVKDMRSNIYIFHGGEFLNYQTRDQADKLPAQIWQSTPGYEIRGRDLWRTSGGEEGMVIQNLISSRTGEFIGYLATALMIGMLWLVAAYLKRRRIHKK